MEHKQHWEQVFKTKAPDSVSWFQTHANQSLEFIHQTKLGKDAAIIDIGAGASQLVDALLAEHYTNITVTDLSSTALALSKQRLGAKANTVHWIECDITQVDFPKHQFDIWHDRAMFHFLTHSTDRHAYIEKLMHAIRPGGHVIIATFAKNGPLQCSGLPTMQYDPDTLHAELGSSFSLIACKKETHHTPFGTTQEFIYCHFRKK